MKQSAECCKKHRERCSFCHRVDVCLKVEEILSYRWNTWGEPDRGSHELTKRIDAVMRMVSLRILFCRSSMVSAEYYTIMRAYCLQKGMSAMLLRDVEAGLSGQYTI
jgi:hypothetical protein